GPLGCETTVGIVAAWLAIVGGGRTGSASPTPVTSVEAVCWGEVTAPCDTPALGAEAKSATESDGTIPAAANAASRSLSNSPAVDCLSLRSLAIARATARPKACGTLASTSCKGGGVW